MIPMEKRSGDGDGDCCCCLEGCNSVFFMAVSVLGGVSVFSISRESSSDQEDMATMVVAVVVLWRWAVFEFDFKFDFEVVGHKDNASQGQHCVRNPTATATVTATANPAANSAARSRDRALCRPMFLVLFLVRWTLLLWLWLLRCFMKKQYWHLQLLWLYSK